MEAASDLGLAYMKSRVGGLGGVVTVDPQGHWATRFSTRQMAWAAAQKDTLHYGLYTGEHLTQSLGDPLWQEMPTPVFLGLDQSGLLVLWLNNPLGVGWYKGEETYRQALPVRAHDAMISDTMASGPIRVLSTL